MKPPGVLVRSQTPPVAKPRAIQAAPSVEAAAPFRVTRRLNSGGTFELLRAAARGDQGPGCYLLKSIRERDLASNMHAARLRREAVVLDEVRHGALNSVLAEDTESADPYLLFPYRDGVSLRRLLAVSRLAVARALGIARQVAEALAALHGAGWLHSQVRPQHVFLSPQGRVTLLDLTLACRLDSPECVVTGGDLLEPLYAAPETGVRGSRVSFAADTYSLGIVLYEMLLGAPPFQGATAREIVSQHRRGAVPDIREVRPDVSLELAHLVRLMLAKDPFRRPSDDQLLRLLANLEIAALV